MKSVLALLALTTAIGTSVVGALSAAPIAGPDVAAPSAASTTAAPLLAGPLVRAVQVGGDVTASAATPAERIQLADNDDDDDDEGFWVFSRKEHRGHDDDDDEYEGGRACVQGQSGCVAPMNPARAGQAAPPANGLFNNGTAPKVQMN